MPRALTAFAYRLVAVLGSALVLLFFSEFYFLNEGPTRTVIGGRGLILDDAWFILAYGLFAYILLILLDRFDVREPGGLILAGAIFGWATESLVVPVAHEAPPVSWFWPSIGWHTVIDVALGWYGLRLAMRRFSWPLLALTFAVLGIAWGCWASWTWSGTEEAPLVLSAGEFRRLALIAGTSWIIGTVLADIGARRRFSAVRGEVALIGLAALALYALTATAFLPQALGLAALIGLTLWALAQARSATNGGADLLARLAPPPPLASYLAMPLMPAAAALSYPVVLDRNIALPTEDIVFVLLVLGALAFAWAMTRAAWAVQRPRENKRGS